MTRPRRQAGPEGRQKRRRRPSAHRSGCVSQPPRLSNRSRCRPLNELGRACRLHRRPAQRRARQRRRAEADVSRDPPSLCLASARRRSFESPAASTRSGQEPAPLAFLNGPPASSCGDRPDLRRSPRTRVTKRLCGSVFALCVEHSGDATGLAASGSHRSGLAHPGDELGLKQKHAPIALLSQPRELAPPGHAVNGGAVQSRLRAYLGERNESFGVDGVREWGLRRHATSIDAPSPLRAPSQRTTNRP